jgi:branched-chain amino acid transport system permease protein
MMKKPSGLFDVTYEQDTALVRTPYRWTMLALLVVGVFGLLPLVGSKYLLDVLTNVAITSIGALGLQILVGFTGVVSIGHAAFVGLGAYGTAILSTHLGLPFWITLPLSSLFCGLIGMLVALPALRIRGFYISVTTLAAHYIIIWVIVHGGHVTNGTSGLNAADIAIGSFTLSTPRHFYYLTATALAIVLLLLNNLMRTKFGRALISVRDNDLAAEFLGINVFRTKVLAFFVSSALAGVAGILQAHYQGIITAEQFSIRDSIWMLGMLIIGGPTLSGAILGVAFLRTLEQVVLYAAPLIGDVFPALGGSAVSAFMQIFFGIVIISFLIFEPRGLSHRWQILLNKFRTWPFSY